MCVLRHRKTNRGELSFANLSRKSTPRQPVARRRQCPEAQQSSWPQLAFDNAASASAKSASYACILATSDVTSSIGSYPLV